MIARMIAFAIAAGAVVGAVVFAGIVGPVQAPAVAVHEVSIMPMERPIACPGPLTVPVGDVDAGDPDLDSTPTERERRIWPDGATTPADGGDGVIIDAPVATSVERVEDGDIAGLAALTCQRAMSDQWLVGGSTALSSSARLVLINPSLSSIEVTVTLFGAAGQVEQRPVVILAPMSQREVLLEGIEAEISSLVVRVESSGAGVVAALQDSRLDGFQPAGSEWVMPVATPAESLVVPGVGVAAGEVEADTEADAGTQTPSVSVLRLLSPEGATVSLTLVTAEGIVPWGGTTGLELAPGVVTDIEVPSGVFGAVEVSADGGVLAAAMSRIERDAEGGTRGSLAYDFSWVGGQDHRDGVARSTVAPGGSVEFAVYSPTTATFVLTDAAGTVVVEREVAARTIEVIEVDVPAGTVVSAQGRFAWSMRIAREPGFVTSLSPVLTGVSELTVSVGLAPYAPVP
ncbi:MAG: hypothetical protein CVT64_09840 [Actinobacteria bacterium HGW-Actinobacteria-4]|nr:MAG: hypothetical protein CVT64_09840 [Actinobacteria bacterium HGW-Actinobacteria-4]